MIPQPAIHASLANGRWRTLTMAEQLGNIGSDVERAFRAPLRLDYGKHPLKYRNHRLYKHYYHPLKPGCGKHPLKNCNHRLYKHYNHRLKRGCGKHPLKNCNHH